MPSKAQKDDRKQSKRLSVSSRCLAILLSPVKDTPEKTIEGKHDDQHHDTDKLHSGCTDGHAADSAHFNPKELFEDFKLRNKTCYWNPALVDSIRSLEYVGFVEPYTILVGGNDIHLENLRTAWGRHVLKDPANFKIENIGDINGIHMQVIPQTQFIPLPEALCLIIMDLNNRQILATLDVVRERLYQWYQGMHLPSDQLIYDTLGALIRERKVFHTGSGYFVVTPDTFRLPTDDPRDTTLSTTWMHFHPMYIPAIFSQQPRAPTRSISCQVSVEDQESPDKPLLSFHDKPMPTIREDISHCSECSNDGELHRPRLIRSLSASRPRRKKEKFQRSLSMRIAKDKSSALDVSMEKSNLNKGKKKEEKVSLWAKLFGWGKKKAQPKKEVEYATFSAQFPPPEWTWYQQLLEKQWRTEQWVHQQITTPKVRQQVAPSSTGGATEPIQQHKDNQVTGFRERALSLPGRNTGGNGASNSRLSKVKSQHTCSKDNSSPSECHIMQNRHAANFNLLSVNDHSSKPADSRPDIEKSNPFNLKESVQHHYMSSPLFSSTPRVPSLLPENNRHFDLTTDQFNPQPTSLPRDLHSNRRRSHRVKKKSCQDRFSSYLPQFETSPLNVQDSDICYEYRGKLPKKNSSCGMSRDSGVNCVGLDVPQGHRNSERRHPHHVSNQKSKIVSHNHLASHNGTKSGDPFSDNADTHIYTNIHMPWQQPLPVGQVQGRRRCNHDNPSSADIRRTRVKNVDQAHKPSVHFTVERERLPVYGVKVMACDQESEKEATGSLSSQRRETSVVDSTLDSSELSFGTVINTRAMIHRPVERLIRQTKDLTLADSGFSSPRNSENSKEDRNIPGTEVSSTSGNFLCNRISEVQVLNNSPHKQEDCSDLDSSVSGRITPGALYENVKIDNSKVLNTMKYLHKDTNVSSQNLSDHNFPHDSSQEGGHSGMQDLYDLKEPIMKKFNLKGDFHVVGVV
ncbi:hypothetical protein CHS0354_004419 [Potamilus streckersoni]|uniref:Winged helix Storkhead-box1 domain-containing protein n=1 Tax=Potamilus streckersoni TaxID=2493646 RepID=A0AAE0TC33_9BIVA|nr:hypothetical protein CHS0354_004419 [Potamilus streckersoni]